MCVSFWFFSLTWQLLFQWSCGGCDTSRTEGRQGHIQWQQRGRDSLTLMIWIVRANKTGWLTHLGLQRVRPNKNQVYIMLIQQMKRWCIRPNGHFVYKKQETRWLHVLSTQLISWFEEMICKKKKMWILNEKSLHWSICRLKEFIWMNIMRSHIEYWVWKDEIVQPRSYFYKK